MKYSLSWINEFVDVSQYLKDPKPLAELLTSAGLEVEGLEDGAKQFANVVVAELIEVGKHPNSDRLTLCQVNVGDGTLRQIVCGAKNHKKGDKVAAALVGAVLPGDFKIKLSKIRDVESQGMLCSEKELGLSGEGEGIMILAANAKVGIPIAEHLGKTDIFLEVNVTPNRADVLSHMGLAREIAILTGKEFKIKPAKFKKSGGSVKTIKLDHQEHDLCARFTGRLIKSVTVGPSSAVIKSRLESLGMKSINNIVDATNYVMLEMGQPLHAYDVKHLKGNTIAVAKSKKGEKFTSFDGSQYELTGDELTIRNAEGVIGLAGVVGSTSSGINEQTKDVYLEGAHFLPASVRRTSRRFGIETDAAQRFSKGVDVEFVKAAMDRCAEIISEGAGGEVSEDAHDSYPKVAAKISIEVDLEKLKARLGFKIPDSEIIALIKKTGSDVVGDSGKIKVSPPKYRVDLTIPEDYLEEVARLKGYSFIEETNPATDRWPAKHALDYQNDRRWVQSLCRAGFSQAVNYVFLDKEFNNKFTLKGSDFEIADSVIEIANPLSDELKVMRSNLIGGLLRNALLNYRYGIESGKLFEVGHVFKQVSETEISETNRLGLLVWGEELSVFKKTNTPAVFLLKEGLSAALKANGIVGLEFRQEDFVMASVHPGQQAKIYYQGKCIGVIGSLHPVLLEDMKWRTEVAVAELNLDAFQASLKAIRKVKEFSKFPGAEKDYAFVVPKTVPTADIIKAMTKAGGDKIESIKIVDSFSDPTWEGLKDSYTFKVLFRKKDASFEDQELVALVQSLRDAVLKARPEVQNR
jgi:phenylalanyl-tRNA synthetase beta chain